MIFSQTPPQFAPLGEELRYSISGLSGNTIISIRDTVSGLSLGEKRLTGNTDASFDTAPYIRRSLLFTPTDGITGFHPAIDRVASISIEAAAVNGQTISTPARTFLASAKPKTSPALLSSMPCERMIAQSECDELTLFTAGPCIVTVTAQTGDTMVAENYRGEAAGLHVFRLNMRDFPDSEILTIDAGYCGTVTYTVDRTPQRGCRLAWRTDAGSIEHYTFPIEKTQSVSVTKKRAYGPSGQVSAAVETEIRTTLCSAFEFRDTLEALAGLLSAPQVWQAAGDGYKPVDVVSETAIVHRHDAVGTLEIEIRPTHKTRSLWN